MLNEESNYRDHYDRHCLGRAILSILVLLARYHFQHCHPYRRYSVSFMAAGVFIIYCHSSRCAAQHRADRCWRPWLQWHYILCRWYRSGNSSQTTHWLNESTRHAIYQWLRRQKDLCTVKSCMIKRSLRCSGRIWVHSCPANICTFIWWS